MAIVTLLKERDFKLDYKEENYIDKVTTCVLTHERGIVVVVNFIDNYAGGLLTANVYFTVDKGFDPTELIGRMDLYVDMSDVYDGHVSDPKPCESVRVTITMPCRDRLNATIAELDYFMNEFDLKPIWETAPSSLMRFQGISTVHRICGVEDCLF